MRATPGWYPDTTKAHGFRYWNGSVWTNDVMDHDVQTKSVYDVTSLPAPEAIDVEPEAEPSVEPSGPPPEAIVVERDAERIVPTVAQTEGLPKLPAPEVIVVEPGVEPSVPTVVQAGAPLKHDVPIGVWILLVGLCLCLVAVIATADVRRMRLWSEIVVFISAICLVAFVILAAVLVVQDRRRADTNRTEPPRTARRFLRRRSTQSSAPSLSASPSQELDLTDDIRLETEPTVEEERSPATS